MIKKGDQVIVISGKDRGKQAIVTRVLPARERLIVEGVNLKKRRERPKKQGTKGQIIAIAAPLHQSNVMLYCANCHQGVRHGVKWEGQKKIRICRSCGRAI